MKLTTPKDHCLTAASGALCALLAILFAAHANADVVDDRLLQIIQDNINTPSPDPQSTNDDVRSWGLASSALVYLYANTNVSTANAYINEMHTDFNVPDDTSVPFTSYFKLHILYRIYADSAMNASLTTSARDDIEDMMWRFINRRSKLTDANSSVWNIHDSENHDVIQKAGFLLFAEALENAGAPYGPSKTLNDGGTISQHADAWGNYFPTYFRERAGEGINCEIASPIYAKYTLSVYYNLRDFAGSAALRDIAEQFLNLYWADVACDWTLSGVRGGAEARAYKDTYMWRGAKYGSHELTWAYDWHGTAGTARTVNLIPTVSSYRIPAIITACATDTNRPNYLYTSRRFGRGGNWVNNTYTVTFDNGDSNLRRDTYVTTDYTMGTLTLDMSKDYIQLIDQNRAMGVMFPTDRDDRIMIYGKGKTSDTRTNYREISGVCRENCMIVQRDPNDDQSTGTLVFISDGSGVNNKVESNGWYFTQIGDAYCAIKPATGGSSLSTNAYGEVMELGDMWAPVVIQMGQAANYASFAAFQSSVQANSFTYASNTLDYTSEASDTFTVYRNSTTTPLINGVTENLNPTKTYDSPYLNMTHGEDVATFSYGSYGDLTLDFSVPVPPGEVTVLNSGSKMSPSTNTTTLSFNAGASASKLVVAVSSEQSNDGTPSITYNGQALTQAAHGAGRSLGIWYLDSPYTGGNANLTVDLSSYTTVNGIGLAAVSLAGSLVGYESATENTGNSITLSNNAADSFAMVNYGKNGGGSVSVDAPLTELYNGDIGSALGASGYQVVSGTGSNTFTITSSDQTNAQIAAAVFDPSPAQTILNPVADAYVRDGTSAGNNYGSVNGLLVKTSTNIDTIRQTYLRFDLSSVSGSVASATLRLKVNTSTSDIHTAYFVSNDSWSESTITFNNKPAGSTSLDSSGVPAAGSWLELDVTNQVATEVAGDQSITVVLISNTGAVTNYHSREATSGADNPQLVIE
jgi:hypothetical protein